MHMRTLIAGLGAVAVAGCSTPDSLEGTRTVFHNPYSALEFENGPVGPECEKGVARSEACYLDTLTYPGRGRYALDRDGNTVRLTRAQRRVLRERFEFVQARIEQLEAQERATGPSTPPTPLVEPPPTASLPPSVPNSDDGMQPHP